MVTAAESLQSHLELVLDERVGALSQDQRRFLDAAFRYGRHLLRLVDDMRAVALAEAGALVLEWTYCDVAALVEHAVGAVWPIAHVGGKKIEVHQEGQARAIADASHLGRALVLLLDHAVDAAPSGTTIGIRASSSEVEITFEDTAVPDEASPSLAFAGAIARAHGGELVVGSEGGTVTVSLSLAADEPLRLAPAA